jgi:hypothetical protein
MPHNIFGKLTIQTFDIIDKSIEHKEGCVEMVDIFKRLTLDALTLAGFGNKTCIFSNLFVEQKRVNMNIKI